MKRVLIVEDDPQVMEMLAETIEQEGYAVLRAENGKTALESVAAEKPDAVVTDIVMPGLDGVELIHSLHKTDPDLPVIAISGGSANLPGDILLRTASLLGAERVHSKPLDLDALLNTLRECTDS